MGCQNSKNVSAESGKDGTSLLSGIKILKAEDFDICKYIAEGGHGKVYEGVHKETQASYALKFFGYTQKMTKMATIETEIELIHKLQGIEGLVKLIGVIHDSEEGLLPNRKSARPYPVIVMELLQGGELFDFIAERDSFSEKNMAHIFKGVVKTLQGMHERRFIHRDVKLENLMFATKDDTTVKVIDFGLVVKLPDDCSVYKGGKAVGSRGYIAPESLTSFEFSAASDVWQAGCTLYMLLSGCFPFDPRNMNQVTDGTYFCMQGIGWDNISAEAKNLVRKMLVKNPSGRITTKEILEHPWIVNEAPSDDLGVDYFTRLKHLVLSQKLKAFFNDSNIKEDSVQRRSVLIDEMPSLSMKGDDFEDKLKVLKKDAVKSFKHELSVNTECSVDVAAGEMDYDGFLKLLEKAQLPELGNRAVFNIFDTGSTGSVDMKDFLLTLIAFKLDEDPMQSSSDQSMAAVDDQCKLYFHLFDIDDTGFINLDELKLMSLILFKDQNIPGLQNTEELFQVMDLDANGKIVYDEFKKFYASILSHTMS